jgi:hypothetical protein
VQNAAPAVELGLLSPLSFLQATRRSLLFMIAYMCIHALLRSTLAFFEQTTAEAGHAAVTHAHGNMPALIRLPPLKRRR